MHSDRLQPTFVRLVFRPEGLVLLKQVIPWSLALHIQGPFIYVSYTCKNCVMVLIRMVFCKEDVAKVLIPNSPQC